MTDTPLRVSIESGVCTAVIDHPPINLLDLPLMLAFDQLGRSVADDPDVRVLVIRSADPECTAFHAT